MFGRFRLVPHSRFDASREERRGEESARTVTHMRGDPCASAAPHPGHNTPSLARFSPSSIPDIAIFPRATAIFSPDDRSIFSIPLLYIMDITRDFS